MGVESCRFVCNGQLIDSELSLLDMDICAGAHVVVVPPRALSSQSTARGRCCRGWSLQGPRRFLYFLLSLPQLICAWFLATWNDPWSLVRPNISEDQRRGRRIQTLDL